jgi:competence protein ComEC
MRKLDKMKTNGIIQLYPMLRLAIFLIIGILFGREYVTLIAPSVWMVTLLGSFVITCLFSFIRWKTMIRIQMAQLQSFMLLLSLVFLGAYDSTSSIAAQPELPDSLMEYRAVVISRPLAYGKVDICNMMIVDGPMVGSEVRASLYGVKERIGDGVEFEGRLEPPYYVGGHPQVFVPYWKTRNVKLSLEELSYWQRTKIAALCLRDRLIGNVNNQDDAIVVAMSLGDKSMLSKDTRDLYASVGCSHILAISGTHMAIIYGILLMIFGHRQRWWKELLVLLAIWAFTIISGFGPSIVRSAMMITIYSIINLLQRQKLSLNTIGLTAFVMLLFHPLSLFDIGWQMSFMAVLGIILMNMLVGKIHTSYRVLDWVIGIALVSLSAQIMTAPLSIYYFHQFASYFLFTNFVVIPIVTVVLYIAVLSLISPLVWLHQIADYMVHEMNLVLQVISKWPGASITGLYMSSIQVIGVYIALFALIALAFKIKSISCTNIRR